MKEEDIIKQHDTGGNPFRTPEGYFEGFTDRLMERMKQEGIVRQPTVKVFRMNPFRRLARYAAAAVVAGVCVGIGSYLYTQRTAPQQFFAGDATELLTDETLDEALDYEMEYNLVNNTQIAYYLTEAY